MCPCSKQGATSDSCALIFSQPTSNYDSKDHPCSSQQMTDVYLPLCPQLTFTALKLSLSSNSSTCLYMELIYPLLSISSPSPYSLIFTLPSVQITKEGGLKCCLGCHEYIWGDVWLSKQRPKLSVESYSLCIS